MTNQVTTEMGGCFPLSTNIQHDTPPPMIYPNPATEVLTINTVYGSYPSFTISNMMGQTVMNQSIVSGSTNVDVKALPAGVYYITFIGATGSEVRKFVKL